MQVDIGKRFMLSSIPHKVYAGTAKREDMHFAAGLAMIIYQKGGTHLNRHGF